MESDENQLFETLLLALKAKKSTKETIVKLYRRFGFDMAFARADIMEIAGITSSPAGTLIDKLKRAGLIETVSGQGKGKYRFIRNKRSLRFRFLLPIRGLPLYLFTGRTSTHAG